MKIFSSLTARIALLSALQFIGVFAGAMLVYRAQAPAEHPFLKVPAEMIALAAANGWHEKATIGARAAVMSQRLNIAIDIRDAQGQSLVAAGLDRPQLNWRASADVVRDGKVVGRVQVSSDQLPKPPIEAWLSATLVAALVLGGSSWLLSRSISRPIKHISSVAARLGAGDLSARVGPYACSGEMKKLATSFDHMAGRLQTLVTAHSELLANVSHELRTPLARARVVLDLAREGAMVDREAITEIASDLDELEHLISEVLTTARLSLAEGQASDLLARLPKQPIDLCDVVDQAAERFRKRFAGIALDVAKPNQAVTCVAAETLLHRALNNLLDNAAGHGGGAPVHLTLEAKNGVSVLEVRDEGPGMRPEDAARAFEPFYRADPSRSKVGGLGLGLTLAHRVALAHGGKIALTSEVGRGTTVRVELPLG